ncbi:MAG: UDP-N-acetylmuramoyl-L-alanine--D-glutamate ligase [Bacillota bacterium]|nr:UDP-N-acetylmuramoyl-L-alanine--D-glutamate ligase [Bacillota bacterium]
MIDLIKGKDVLVVGMARSGVAAAKLLARAGAAKITVTDLKSAAQLRNETNELSKYPNVYIMPGGNPPDLVREELSMIIKSPGVPSSLELFKKANELGVPVFSEVELAYNFSKAPIIGVTGTNGKTTTTALIGAMLKEASFAPVITAGNIGHPLADAVNGFSAQGMIVAELSSFQLENIRQLRSMVAVFLNFTEDHLDYHGTVEKYFEAKARIFENQKQGDFAVLNAGDGMVASLAERCRGQILWFARRPVDFGAGLEDKWITLYKPGCKPLKLCLRDEVIIPGEHNLENALASAAAAWAAGADPQSIGRTLRSFRAIEHRLEYVTNLGGVDYINDSKGTNPDATIRALNSFPGRGIILIAGGKDKGSDFSSLAETVRERARLLLLLGETREKITDSLNKVGFQSVVAVPDLQEAVHQAAREARSGEIVLLSPACASWDMFKDYEERGNLFKKIVLNLQRECGERRDMNGR